MTRFSSPYQHHLVADERDVDELGHIGNQAYLKWILDAAKAHSRSVGLDWSDYFRLGALFVVKRHEIDYLESALAGDAIVATTWIASLRGATSVRETRVVRAHDGRELARGNTLWVLVDAHTRRPKRIPDTIAAAFRSAPDAG